MSKINWKRKVFAVFYLSSTTIQNESSKQREKKTDESRARALEVEDVRVWSPSESMGGSVKYDSRGGGVRPLKIWEEEVEGGGKVEEGQGWKEEK